MPSDRNAGAVRYGTSSWGSKGWVGPFYPDGTKPADFLAYYGTQFDTVEADNTYYGVPRSSMVDGWARKTPEGFLVAAKFPRSIVHGGDGAKPDPERVLVPDAVGEDTGEFLDAMGRLGPKCGPLLLQFPFFNKSVFPGRDAFLERLDAYLATLPKDFRYAVEVRNKYWIDATLLDLLRRHGVALTLVDLAYMPHPASLWPKWDLVTADFVYCRLIGDRKAVDARTKTFDRVVVDQSERLDRWAELLAEITLRVPETFVYANNHYAGHGPATIRDLRERM